MLGRPGNKPGQAGEPIPGIKHHLLYAPPDFLPTQTRLEVDGRRHRQPSAGVARSLELQVPQTRRRTELVASIASDMLCVPAPAHLKRLQSVFVATPKVQQPRAGR